MTGIVVPLVDTTDVVELGTLIVSLIGSFLLGAKVVNEALVVLTLDVLGKTEHFKALSKNCQTSAIADHITSTGHNIKWDHFEILATGRSDIHCRKSFC